MWESQSSPAPSPFISIIDDDISVRQALDRLIRSLDHDVIAFSSANEFLRYPQFTQTACLILDVQMPGLSGIELQNVVSVLRRSIPIIFITAHHDDDIRSRAMAAGAIGYLEKPFDEQSLIQLLDQALKPQTK